ncbi:NADPH-cytochrome P450 reductase-like protein [Paraphoma chrysanthemicola]|uniref:Bifunctional cytochrome P450/NADPH--P450 reductase n=1 Tax=Paraphoma chrysanthemicola TaxID=798071 RepID=A0A8K0W526_9PLEO|nr:NADPH-cytochrome P450 reductase-like protein [Paraphoma chrysanthemicola]
MEYQTIPGPPGLPILGNLSDIDAQNPIQSLCNLTTKYGPLWKFNLGGERIVIASQALMDEVCNEERFSKIIAASLEQVRNGVHSGLFTAYGPQEKEWGIAHRVLLPQLGPLSIRNMFNEMHDIASQLVMKWARHGGDHTIQVVDDFTRLTLDTIALCAMDYRFNSYYSQDMHPFIDAMSDFLKVSGDRARRDVVTQMFYRGETQKYWEDIELLRKTSLEVIQTRRNNPTDKKDLLNGMLNGVDPKTGEKMSDESLIDNMITFLIAGHETTSGLLSFTFYYLLKNPAAYEKAQHEVDEVIGKGPITVDHLTKLPYLNAVLRESIRLSPTAPAIGLTAKEDTTLDGKYRVTKGTPLMALLPMVHRDPVAYGEDAEEFRPERMLDAEFDRRNKEFPNCWKPFGNGMRACIGRPFAWQEALLVLAMLLQNFNFSMEDSSYQLQIKQTLTIKPKDFYMRAHLRNGVSATSLERGLASATLNDVPATKGGQQVRKEKTAKGKPMAIYYGSNTGTCEALANRLASDAANHGFRADVVDTLDSVRENLPTDKPIVIITASYEGQPTDNAAHFVNWVGTLKENALQNVSYSVFGCGHHDWAKTFHRIPKYIDATFAELGATKIVDMGSADAAHGDIFTDFEAWEDQRLWPAMREKYGSAEAEGEGSLETTLDVEISTPRSTILRQDVREARVEEVQVLSDSGVVEKRHIEISLPSDMSYSAGDYLAILPLNPKENIRRATKYFGLSWDSMLTISSAGPTTLPTDTPISAIDVFGAYIELAQPASKRNVLALADATRDEATKNELSRLAEEAFSDEITAKRVSILDLLERFPSVQLPLGVFLKMQPPMRVRQYSISSSPLWNPTNVTLTYSVLDNPALSGQGRYVGVASNYLANLVPGDKLHVSVRSSHQAFHLPKDAKNVPVIMIAAGTGLAPFRGFIQERAAQLAAGRALAPALLFYGCRAPTSDLLYADVLKRWEQLGAVSLRLAFSREPESSEGCKYVQDRVYHDRSDIVELFDAGAKLFVCGSAEVGQGVQETLIRIAKERKSEVDGREVDDAKAREWFEGLRNERFATDVFT